MISIRDIENFDMFEFSKELTDDSEIKCPMCGEWSKAVEWKDGLSYCEDCGDHCALTCPNCDDQYDHVWAEEIEVK